MQLFFTSRILDIMCYEFVHACKSPLIDQITSLIGASNYFLVCIGSINYFYCKDTAATAIVRGLLMIDHTALHNLSESEMLSVIDFPALKAFETFHGDAKLLSEFKKRNTIAC
jgi:hypothetical protein